MNPKTNTKIILVVRETRIDGLIARFNTLRQATFYVEHLGEDFTDYEEEDAVYKEAVRSAEHALGIWGHVQKLPRKFLSNFVFGKEDLVVALGQDGLVANTLKYLDRQPVIGVNPDAGRWDGALLPYRVPDLAHLLPEVIAQRCSTRDVTMAQVRLTDGQVLYAVNDFFIGRKTHVSARYRIRQGERDETQSSSGIIVSTGLGSTGWFKSVLAGAIGIVSEITDHPLGIIDDPEGFAWDAPHLRFSVREPFPSKTTHASFVVGAITSDAPLTVTSQMSEEGVIFSDGMERDFLAFNSGMRATVNVADKRGRLFQ